MPLVQNREIQFPNREYMYILSVITLGKQQLWPRGLIEKQSRSFSVANKVAQV